MEIKEIPGFPGYFASTTGGIYSNTRNKNRMRKMSPYTDRYGYLVLKPRINGKMKTKGVHRLVAMTFIPNPENKPQVNHKNGLKTDNRLENLEWATASENTQHAVDNGLLKVRTGEDSNFSVITEDDVRKICEHLQCRTDTVVDIANKLGYSAATVYKIARKERWVHISQDYNLPDARKIKAKLKDAVVIDICGLLNGGHSVAEVSNFYDIPKHTVAQISYRARYKTISEVYLH